MSHIDRNYLFDIKQPRKRLAAGVDGHRERRLHAETQQRACVLHEEVAYVVPERVVEEVAVRRGEEAVPRILAVDVHHGAHQGLHLALVAPHEGREVEARVGDGARAVARREHLDVLQPPQLELECGAAGQIDGAHVVVCRRRRSRRCVVILLLHGDQSRDGGRAAVVELGAMGVGPLKSRLWLGISTMTYRDRVIHPFIRKVSMMGIWGVPPGPGWWAATLLLLQPTVKAGPRNFNQQPYQNIVWGGT